MSKYHGGLTLSERCEQELDEARYILSPYSLDKEDLERILGMIIEPYFQLSEMSASARAVDKLIAGHRNYSFAEYVNALEEEKRRYPFCVSKEDKR